MEEQNARRSSGNVMKPAKDLECQVQAGPTVLDFMVQPGSCFFFFLSVCFVLLGNKENN